MKTPTFRVIMNDYLLFGLLILGMMFFAYLRMKKRRKVYRRLPDRDFPRQWTAILEKRVPFYQRLSISEKKDFQYKCHVFLLNHKITARETELTDLDQVLIAAGAVIPIFRLEKWHYTLLKEVFIYPDKFLIPETDQMARGLVGWGAMAGQVWFSRKAIYEGFHIDNDQKNVVIHEFIHLMDMQDGFMDGVLDHLMSEDDIDAWLELVRQKSEHIGTKRSSIREYAKENPVEFLAASGEFYFESPDKMRQEHPVLYGVLDRLFNPKANWF